MGFPTVRHVAVSSDYESAFAWKLPLSQEYKNYSPVGPLSKIP